MTVFAINMIGLLCLVLAALFMAFSETSLSSITFSLCAIGLIGLISCAWATIGRLFITQCESFFQLCAAQSSFENLFGQLLRNEDKASTVFLGGGFVGIVSLIFAMYVGLLRKPNIKVLVSIGCAFLVLGGVMQLYAGFSS